MNCFHFSVSLGYNTTSRKCTLLLGGLWIAFIFQYLWDTTQPSYPLHIRKKGCELLSFFSIFGIQHNYTHYLTCWNWVVNCFHFSVSLGYNTTEIADPATRSKLWIAFIFQYLWDTTQLVATVGHPTPSCELLSFFSIFGIQHNNAEFWHYKRSVVNCFHFSVSLGYNTTFTKDASQWLQLWIAFIFQYLWDTTQHGIFDKQLRQCCELLSFFSIFGIQHNDLFLFPRFVRVVNCFHFSVSLGYNTTYGLHG